MLLNILLFLFLVVASSNESQQSIITSVQQEMAQRRKQKTNGNVIKNGTTGNSILPTAIVPVVAPFMTRQDSRLSVKSLIESIENTSKQAKLSGGSQSGSATSLNSLTAMDQQQDEKIHSTAQEKQEKTLNNNSITSNNNLNGNSNGMQKNSGRRFYLE